MEWDSSPHTVLVIGFFFFPYPECNTGLFSVDFPVIVTTKVDSRQSTILQVTFWDFDRTRGLWKGRFYRPGRTPGKPPPPMLALSARVPQLSTHLSWPRPRSGFSFSKMHFAFFVCFVEMFLKRRFYVIIRRSVVNCTAVVIRTYFYIKYNCMDSV